MSVSNVLSFLQGKFGDAVLSTSETYGDAVATVKADSLLEIATWLKESHGFNMPVFCTCIDNLDRDPDGENRFEVCYQVRFLESKETIRLKVPVSESSPKVPSLESVWVGMNWLERETFDMYGIEFEKHSDLRRIYMYDEFVGYPLRKDYPKDKRQPLVRRDWDDELNNAERQAAIRKVGG